MIKYKMFKKNFTSCTSILPLLLFILIYNYGRIFLLNRDQGVKHELFQVPSWTVGPRLPLASVRDPHTVHWRWDLLARPGPQVAEDPGNELGPNVRGDVRGAGCEQGR